MKGKNVRKQVGLTMVEALLTSVILGALIVATISAFSSGMRTYSSAASITSAESDLRVCLDNIIAELWEADPALVWVNSFNDPNFTNPQEALTFCSPRNAVGQFIFSAGLPVWQSVCVFCPYAYIDGRGTLRKELRRYEWTGVPAAYLQTTFTLNCTITSTQIQLSSGVTLNRNQGRVILNNLDDFGVSGNYPLLISLQSTAPGNNNVIIRLSTQLAGRNKN